MLDWVFTILLIFVALGILIPKGSGYRKSAAVSSCASTCRGCAIQNTVEPGDTLSERGFPV